MKTLKKWWRNPKVRLAERAVAAGLAVSFVQLKGGHLDHAAIEAAVVAGGWTAFELAFPGANNLLGWFKIVEQIEPKLKVVAPPETPKAA